MKPINRAPFMFGAAVILPLIIFFGIQFAFSARDQRETVRAQTLAKTERVLVEADGKLQRTLGALDVLATARSVNEATGRHCTVGCNRSGAMDSGWVTVRLTDLATGETLFDLRQPYGAGVSSEGFSVPDRRPGVERAYVGDMGGSGPGCPCALAYRFISRDGVPRLVADGGDRPDAPATHAGPGSRGGSGWRDRRSQRQFRRAFTRPSPARRHGGYKLRPRGGQGRRT
jgi:hypothetical protein